MTDFATRVQLLELTEGIAALKALLVDLQTSVNELKPAAPAVKESKPKNS